MQKLTGLGNTTSKAFHLDQLIQEKKPSKVVWALNEDENGKELYQNLSLFSEYQIFTLKEDNKLRILSQFAYSSKPSVLIVFNNDLANQKVNN